DRADGDAGAGGRGEKGRLVRGGGRRAGDEQQPGARPAGNQAAQRAAAQRHEQEQEAAADDAGGAHRYRAGAGRGESAGGRGGAPQGGGEQNVRGPAQGPGNLTQRSAPETRKGTTDPGPGRARTMAAARAAQKMRECARLRPGQEAVGGETG